MSILKYLFTPEDSTLGVTETITGTFSWSVRTVKLCLWITASMLMSMGISLLS